MHKHSSYTIFKNKGRYSWCYYDMYTYIFGTTKVSLIKLATVSHGDLLRRLTGLGPVTFDLLHDIHALHHFSEHDVLLVQPGSLGGGDEELGSVGVGAGVSHGHDAGAGVLQLEVFILELLAVDGLAPGTVVVGEVSSLAHEAGDDSVEDGALVAESLLPRAESSEVLRCLGHHIGAQLVKEETLGYYTSFQSLSGATKGKINIVTKFC